MVMQNRPNPFGVSSSFDLGLPTASSVHIEVFDVGGRRVASHALGAKPAGWQTVTLDARDDAGQPLASGVYFYRVHAAGQTLTRKMVIAR
jgi:flagellar hook assembly protein FlgD